MSVDLFDADLATVSAAAVTKRASTTIAEYEEAWAAFDAAAAERAEFVARYAVADDDTRLALLLQAQGLDDEQPFGPRLMDELRGLHTEAAA